MFLTSSVSVASGFSPCGSGHQRVGDVVYGHCAL